MNAFDPIKELYNLYSEEEKTPQIMEVVDDGLGWDLDMETGSVDLYVDL